MKIRAFVVFALVVCGLTAIYFLAGATRSSASLPDLAQAIRAQNTPELIRALISRLKAQQEKDDDTFPQWIKEVEAFTATCPDTAAVALLHSMTAEMYQTYYRQNQWTINQRTPLAGYIPADIREWTANLFENKVREELTASLRPARLLQQTPADRFAVLFTPGKDSETLRPTLFDFLAFRAIDIQPSDAWYQALLAFRRTQPDAKALMLDELDYLRFTYSDGSNHAAAYQAALDSLLARYAGQPFSTEIQIARLDLLEGELYPADEARRDSIKGEIVRLCQTTIARYPDYPRTNLLRNKLAQMEQPALIVETGNNVYPGKNLSLRLKYVNTPQVTLRIYESLRTPEMAWKRFSGKDKQMRGKLLAEKKYTLPLTNSYTQQDTTLELPAPGLGLYEYELSAPGKSVAISDRFCVSRLGAMTRNLSGGKTEVFVTDYESGKPSEGTTVLYYRTNAQGNPVQLGQLKTDREGLVTLPGGGQIDVVRPIKGDDRFSLFTQVYPSGDYRRGKTDPVDLSLFTDRGLYRPGQTLFFKGIAYVKTIDDPHVVAGRSVTVGLHDANGKEIARKSFTTNPFGSFNGEFTLPRQTLSGMFSLRAGDAFTYVRVEEYKRPTFRITIPPLKQEVAFGRPLTIEGKAETYSGVALQTGQVNWRVIRRPFWLRPYFPSAREEQVAEGTTTVNNRGEFAFTFTPEKANRSYPMSAYQSYEVIATLTDGKGETQEARYSFHVGESGIWLSIDMQPQMNKDSAGAAVHARTLNGKEVTVSGTYLLSGKTDSLYRKTGAFTSGKPLAPELFRSLPSGAYRLQVEATDTHGQKVTAEGEFIVYSPDDKRPPVFSHTWLLSENTECLPGEEATFVFGTSDKEVYILYEIYRSNRQGAGLETASVPVSRKLIRMSDENRRFSLPFTGADGEGIVASFTFVKDGQLYVAQQPIYRKQPDRRLTIRPETFRDRLLPGSKESWKFRILNADSAAVKAEVLAGMYDLSLDQLSPFRWNFHPVNSLYLQAPRFTAGTAFLSQYEQESTHLKLLKVPQYQYDRLNWQGLLQGGYRMYNAPLALMENGVSSKAVAKARIQTDVQADAQPAATNSLAGNAEVVSETEESGERIVPVPDTNGTQPAVIRENFAETAFFYPVLVTDSTGDVAFSFTLPESNTTWKLQLLAQTTSLDYGYWSGQAVASKPFMVLPNLPRFLRQGDEVTISTQVINQTGTPAEGRARLELFDPATGDPVVCLSKSQKPFTLEADSTLTLSWTITVPSGVSLIGCRIVAESDRGSDGEQQLIPVLSDELFMTESTPFYLTAPGETVIRPMLPKGSRPFRLTLELSADPVWYAVQALPALTQPDNDNILSWFAAYYSNTLASAIVRDHPRIRQVIQQWTARGGDASTLLSNLEKNTELKAILLEETPWVLAATTETEQKERLSLLFDSNRAEGLRAAALQQLIQQQTPDGGWSWFKGFPASPSITRSILKGMARLIELNAVEYGQEEKEMQIKALHFLDGHIHNEYDAWQKQSPSPKKQKLTPGQIDYLFVRSYYRDIPERGDAREAIRFYTTLAEKEWSSQTLYGKGEIALLMHRNGKKQVAADILAWLRKTATYTPEKGMYWANNRRGTDYDSSPIGTHCLLMTVFHTLAPDTATTDRMKQWLLNQKQTQQWESVPATVDAVYALLLTGSDWLNGADTCTVTWGKHTFTTADGEAGTGYIRRVVDQPEITPAYERLAIHKTGKAPAWGAVYTQYFQPITEVTANKGAALNVEKKLFIETNSANGLQLVPLTPERPLRIGDKVVVRLTVRTNREMDYVYLKDLRAGCFEPADPLSGSEFRDGIWYYRSPEDVSENFFFNRLPIGTFVLEYPVYVTRRGDYAGGVCTIQCLYAPEFVSHTEGYRIKVE